MRKKRTQSINDEYSIFILDAAPLLGYYLVRTITFFSVPLRTNVLGLNHV